ncbi:MAG: chromate transporter, partial [Victivallaceae bacterium]|nr:chromate transporter [Victivallaceae bacterium]
VPGIIACNSAVCIGWRIAGVVGALAAALGAITPSVAIIALIVAGMSRLEDFLSMPAVQGAFRCVIAAIVAMVVTVGIKLGKKAADSPFAWAVAILSFVGMSIFKISPVWLIVGAIAAGEIYSLIRDLNMRRRHGSR